MPVDPGATASSDTPVEALLGFDEARAALRALGTPHFWYGNEGSPEPYALYRLAREAAQVGPILEIGTYCGYSAALMAAAGATVITVDSHETHWDHQRAYKHAQCPDKQSIVTARRAWEALGLTGRIKAVVGRSDSAKALKAAPSRLGGLFLDGDHNDEPLGRDLELYAPRLVPGGLLIAHDWGTPSDVPTEEWNVAGVVTAWVELTGGAEAWEGPGLETSLAWFRRLIGPDEMEVPGGQADGF